MIHSASSLSGLFMVMMMRGPKFIVLLVLAITLAGFLTWKFALGSGFIDEFHVLPGSLQTTKHAAPVSNGVSQALVGKQITIRGKLLAGKPGAYVLLDNQVGVYLIPRVAKPYRKDPYAEMDGKFVEATGTLRFYHEPVDGPVDNTVQRAPDRFYFEAESTQVKLFPPHNPED